jgi:hypothetical protein
MCLSYPYRISYHPPLPVHTLQINQRYAQVRELDQAIRTALGRGRLATAFNTVASLLPRKGRHTARGYEAYGRLLEARLPDHFVNLLAPEVVQRRAQYLCVYLAGIYDCEEVGGWVGLPGWVGWVALVWGEVEGAMAMAIA